MLLGPRKVEVVILQPKNRSMTYGMDFNWCV